MSRTYRLDRSDSSGHKMAMKLARELERALRRSPCEACRSVACDGCALNRGR